MEENSTAEMAGANEEVETISAEENAPESEEVEESETPDEAETEEGEQNPEEKKGPKKLTFEERQEQIQKQIAELKEERARIAFEREQAAKAVEAVPFVEVDMARFEQGLAEMMDSAESLRLNGQHFEAAKVQRQIDNLIDSYEQNEAKKAEYLQKQQQRHQETTAQQQRMQRLDQAAEIFRQQYGIDQAAWDRGGEFLAAEFQRDKTVAAEFVERVQTQGAMAAIKWAHNYVSEKQGRAVEQQIAQRNNAKGTNVAGGAKATSSALSDDLPYEQWVKLREKQLNARKR